MSSLSIPLSGKLSDGQFIGDLMSLFERRKLKCGDPQIFETFGSELVSNNILRSDLFSLCTAISHMAAADLSGDELLVLVARALGGPGMAKGAAPGEIPESMRTAFLDGYKAWSNRGSANDVSSPWPPVRQTVQREEASPGPPSGDSDSASDSRTPKDPAENHRTLQEAFYIVRERAGNGFVQPRAADSAASLDHLTISQLKNLMADIENRVSRIDSQASEAGAGSPAAEVGSRESAEAGSSGADARAAEMGAQKTVPPLVSGSVLQFESAGRPAPARSKFDESAFLERHPYMKPTTRTGTVVQGTTKPAAQVAEMPPSLPVASVPAAEIAQAVSLQAVPASAEMATVAPAVTKTDGIAPLAVPVAAPPLSGVIQPEPVGQFTEVDPPRWFDPDRPRIHFRVPLREIALIAALFVLAGVSAGFYVYHSLHPKTINDFPDLNLAVASGTGGAQDSTVPHDGKSDAELILSTSDDASMGMKSRVDSPDAPGTVRSKPKTSAPVAVWPQTDPAVYGDVDSSTWNQSAGALAVTRHAMSGGKAIAAPPRNTPAGGAPHIPSATMIGYVVSAPKPAYPAGIAKGITGTVVVQVAISRLGTVTGAWAVSGPDELRPAAVQAVQGWRFRPYLVNGTPAEITTTLGFFFNAQ